MPFDYCESLGEICGRTSPLTNAVRKAHDQAGGSAGIVGWGERPFRYAEPPAPLIPFRAGRHFSYIDPPSYATGISNPFRAQPAFTGRHSCFWTLAIRRAKWSLTDTMNRDTI
jgi:hypothetical protein